MFLQFTVLFFRSVISVSYRRHKKEHTAAVGIYTYKKEIHYMTRTMYSLDTNYKDSEGSVQKYSGRGNL